MVLFLAFMLIFSANAQSSSKTTAQKQTTKSRTVKPGSSIKTTPVEIKVVVTSKCEKNVMIFAGPKENLRNPKMKEFGGLSVNTLYVKTGNAVCIMDAKKKPVSCVSIVKGTTRLEINSSGTVIEAK